MQRAHANAEAAHAESAERLTMIEQQQAIIREMTVPVLTLSASVLLMPLVGALDSERLLVVQQQALQTIERSSARRLILDITGVPVVDEAVARGMLQVVEAARLLGVETVVVGIRPEVAQAIVAVGINLSRLTTFSSLQDSFNLLLNRQR
jgi:rsbT co-antagonist protein RsbR